MTLFERTKSQQEWENLFSHLAHSQEDYIYPYMSSLWRTCWL